MRDIGKNIKQLRVQRKLTQDELAERLFVTRQTVSNYENGKSKPDIDMLLTIADVLDTDIHRLIYGPEPTAADREWKRLIFGAAATAAALGVFLLIRPIAADLRNTYVTSLDVLNHALFLVLILICIGWTAGQLTGMALRRQPLAYHWVKYARVALVVILAVYLGLMLLCFGAVVVNDLLYMHKLRGQWVEHEVTNTLTGEVYTSMGYQSLPVPLPKWLMNAASGTFFAVYRHIWVFVLAGAALWLLGLPKRKTN